MGGGTLGSAAPTDRAAAASAASPRLPDTNSLRRIYQTPRSGPRAGSRTASSGATCLPVLTPYDSARPWSPSALDPARGRAACSGSRMQPTTLWGVDLGGTKIEAAVIDASRPTAPLHRVRLETESSQGYDHIVGRIRTAVEQLASATGLTRPRVIGIGTPGTTEPASGLLKNSNTVCLNGQPLAADLSAALGAECRLANDANCFALAEASLGAARGRDVVIGLILGTGVGSGIVVHGRA